MILKANIASVIIPGCLFIMITSSCQSHIPKADDAFERVKNERMMSKDSNKSVLQQSMVTQTDKKVIRLNSEVVHQNQDEWSKYKFETERKIHANEITIRQIKSLGNPIKNLSKKIAILEKENNGLITKMDEYNEEVKMKWENFKTMMNHDVNEIDIELKSIKNKQ